MEGNKKKFIRELAGKARTRKESGLFIVDGPKMCSEIPEELLTETYVTDGFLHSEYLKCCEKILQKGFYTVSETEMKQLSDTVTPQGILCIVKKPERKKIPDLLKSADDKAPLLIILETLQDPGNLGTIFRASEAAGITGILMNSSTADVFSPKTVRSTMGSVFRVPFVETEDLVSCVRKLKQGVYTDGSPVHILAASLTGKTDYTVFDYCQPCAYMIGNESSGLGTELMNEATETVRIPMEGHVESLNAAMAASVIGFEAYRQRRRK